MFREALANARARGDVGMVRAMKVELAMLGETTEPEPLETAVPVKPRRGRRPLPRCEHGMILMRCPDCSPEEVVA
jgi:hypothetical protein